MVEDLVRLWKACIPEVQLLLGLAGLAIGVMLFLIIIAALFRVLTWIVGRELMEEIIKSIPDPPKKDKDVENGTDV